MKALAGRQNHATAPEIKRPRSPQHVPASRIASPSKPPCACGGSCPRCHEKKQRSDGPLQAKLQVGKAGDVYEQEADQIAERIVSARSMTDTHSRPAKRAPVPDGTSAARASQPAVAPVQVRRRIDPGRPPALQPKCACGGALPCRACSDDKEERLQRKRDGGGAADAMGTSEPKSYELLQLGPGRPLGNATRSFMESQFGTDFGHVRIHDDATAATTASDYNALAFTVGHDIVFGAGRYSPHSSDGTRLLAHELTHVVQQGTQPQGRTLHRSTRPLLQRQATPGLEPLSGDQDSTTGGTGTTGCPKTPTGLGNVAPAPPCTQKPSRDIGQDGEHFGFCPDSDHLTDDAAASVSGFVAGQAIDAQYIVHGYASPEGGFAYNSNLACHRANAMAESLKQSGITVANVIEVASKGPTSEFGGDAESNRVAVVLAEVPPGRRFGDTRPDPGCPATPTNLGNVHPDPACPEEPRDIGSECMELDEPQRSRECDSYHFCLDSDIFEFDTTPRSVMRFARKQPSKAHFVVHGYASDEGPHNRAYNFRLACHRANRLARELMNASVPPEQISIATKGPTSQFPGGPEFNRVGFVRAMPPTLSPTPEVEVPTTQAEKHAIMDTALGLLDEGGYRLEADAYIAFWTCGRVPTLRHAVNTTQYFAEGDPGIPKLKPDDLGPNVISAGESGGRLGLNTAVISNQVFATGDVECVMAAMVLLSFSDKVDKEDFGTDRGKDSDLGKARRHFAGLTGLNCTREATDDPLKDKPPPKCLQVPGPAFKGKPAPGEVGARTPRFQVDESSFRGSSGSTVFLSPIGNHGSMETGPDALTANATVSLFDQPQEFRNYDIGYVLTRTVDSTVSEYGVGEQIDKGLPTPIRDTDGFRPIEPWYSDGAFVQVKSNRVTVAMSKTMAELVALRHQELGKPDATLGAGLARATHHSEFQLWLVARRRGAPLDRFSTHFLSGTRAVLDQDLTMTDGKASGSFNVGVPVTGGDPRPIRFSGPIPEDLGLKETTTTNVVPEDCDEVFGRIQLKLGNTGASSVGGAFVNRTTIPAPQTITMVTIETRTPVDFKPRITAAFAGSGKSTRKLEVGLIQNLLSLDDKAQYSGGKVVESGCFPLAPLRDGSNNPPEFDQAFMTNHPPEMEEISDQRPIADLVLSDVPTARAVLDLATHPVCPGKNSGTLQKITSKKMFRTWVAARLKQDRSCMKRLLHIDWQTNWTATLNPDKANPGSMDVTKNDGDGKPEPVLGDTLANDACQLDDACL